MAKRKPKEYKNIAWVQEDTAERVNFAEIFGRNAPVHVEIGSGKGAFLLQEARARPDCDFLGIEWARKYYLYIVDRIGRWGLPNVRIIRTDVAAFLPVLSDASVAAFHVYFPDPWPKKRHHKRRFINPQNIDEMIRCLCPGGLINVATDHSDYFDQIRRTIAAAVAAGRLLNADFVRSAAALPGEHVGTNYERKYLTGGKPIFTIAARKPA
jgi:tRNA (guanine-N7-)-methyltransferase